MPASKQLSETAKNLIYLSQAIVRSGSHLEDAFWEQELAKALSKALVSKRSKHVEKALETLLEQRSSAYEILVEYAESLSESVGLENQGQHYDTLLICAPILARTRYKLPSGKINKKQVNQLSRLITDTVLESGVKVSIVPELVRFDCLPQSFRATRELNQALANRALGIDSKLPKLENPDGPADLLADVFFIIGTVVIPQGQAIFKWQKALANHLAVRDEISNIWSGACNEILGSIFTGCQNEYIYPDAYYTSTRKADQYIRPIALKAAISWLDSVANVPVAELRAAIVACGDNTVEEYRIGFTTRHNKQVIYGCIWPSLNRDEAIPDQIGEGQITPWDVIAAILKDSGITNIRRIPGIQSMDFCDDCGTPYFPNMLGTMMHPELPDDVELDPIQFH